MTDMGPVVEEAVVRLVANGRLLFEWRCTPVQLEALAVGRLYAEGMMADTGLAAQLRLTRADDALELQLAADVPRRARMQRAREPRSVPSTDSFTELFRTLFAGVDRRHAEGGMHAAALVQGAQIAFQAEDVGRHNAVDKVIGLALLAGAPIAGHGMLVSSRVSGEIARKAAQSGVAWLASRSIPTTLAVAAARAHSMPIIGRAAGRNAFVYQ